MIIRENKIIGQFPTPNINKSGCYFENWYSGMKQSS